MRISAFIIKKIDTNEYDQLVSCFSEQSGKIMAIAKSILRSHSKQAMHLDEYGISEFELIPGKNTPIITAAQQQETFLEVKESLPRLAAAQFLAEALDKLVAENQKDEQLWEFIVSYMVNLSKTKESEILPFFKFRQSELFEILGYGSHTGSELDYLFEQTAGKRFTSLRFLYKVLQ